MVDTNNLKAQLQQEAVGQRRGLSFRRLAVKHGTQEFVLKDGNVEKVLGKQVELLIVSEYGQYVYFDPKTERTTILSQIKKPFEIKNSIDLKSGKKMSEIIENMKAQNTKLTYNNILLVMVKVGNEWQEALFYLKGALLQSWFEIVKEITASDNNIIGNIVKLSLKAQKKGSVRYATLFLEEFINCEDNNVISSAVAFLKRFKEEVKSYNQFRVEKEAIEEESMITSLDDVEF